MTHERMREKLKMVYPNQTWSDKVDAMDERQVVAIFLSMKEAGRLDKKNAKEAYEKWKESKRKPQQLDIFAELGLPRYVR